MTGNNIYRIERLLLPCFMLVEACKLLRVVSHSLLEGDRDESSRSRYN